MFRMQVFNQSRAVLVMASLAVAGVPAQAALYGDASAPAFGAIDENFESFDGLLVSPPASESLASGSVGVSATIDLTLGAFAVDLNENGTWGAGNHFAGIGDLVNGGTDYDGSMYFSFDPAYGAGAKFSIYQEVSGTASIMLEAYGAGDTLLESHEFVINFADPFLSNAGLFYGVGRAGADVVGIRVTGNGFVLDDLRVAASPVPVPAALPLLASAVAFCGFLRRRG